MSSHSLFFLRAAGEINWCETNCMHIQKNLEGVTEGCFFTDSTKIPNEFKMRYRSLQRLSEFSVMFATKANLKRSSI